MESSPGVKFQEVGNTDSPCTALLERLKDLRKWQDEKRKEILNHSNGSYEMRSPKEVEFHGNAVKNVESLEFSSIQGDTNSKTPDHNNKSIREVIISPEFQSLSKESSKISSPTFSCEISKLASNLKVLPFQNTPEQNTNNNVSSSPDLTVQEDHKQCVANNSFQKTIVQSQDKISDNVNYKINEEEFPNENEVYASVRDPSNCDNLEKRYQGLGKFRSRHSQDNLMGSDDDIVSESKPKFTYLKKGKGLARFKGKRLVGFKNKKNSRQDQTKERGVQNEGLLTSERSNVPSKDFRLNTGRMAVKTLQLCQDHKNSLRIAKCTEEKVLIPANKKERFPVTLSDVQEKKGTRCKEEEELSAFEKLEELADDSSFSSNSSVVIRLLQRGIDSSSSTPIKALSHGPKLSKNIPVEYCNGEKFSNPLGKFDQVDIWANQIDSQQNPYPLVNVSVVLEQLKGLVRLEDLEQLQDFVRSEDLHHLSEEDFRSVLESFIDPESSFQVGSISCFENNMKLVSSNPTSTPTVHHDITHGRRRVHFPKGVQVLEYELSESDGENTLTDMASIADDTDLVSTSDLDGLLQINPLDLKSAKNAQDCDGIFKRQSEDVSSKNNNVDKIHGQSSSSRTTQPVCLEFSPSRRPKNAASHYIWSIFGKEGAKKVLEDSKTLQQDSSEEENKSSNVPEPVIVKTGNKIPEGLEKKESSQLPNRIENHEEFETYKTLLMAKVCQLEKEMDFYKQGNEEIKKGKAKIKHLQESLKKEWSQIDLEKKKFQEEKEKFQKYVDSERNKLWKERQSSKPPPSMLTSAREQSLEMVYLKEQLNDLQEELQKKDSMHTLAVNKLHEKIKGQEQEIRSCKSKITTLQKCDMGNVQQKQKIDRGNMNKKPLAKTTVTTTGKPKNKTKVATISSINRSLDKVPITINDPSKLQNKITNPDRQTVSNQLSLGNYDSGKRDSKLSDRAIQTKLPSGESITNYSKNSLNCRASVDSEKRTNLDEVQGLSYEDQPVIQSSEARNSAAVCKPSLLPKVTSEMACEVENYAQTQDTMNIECTEFHLEDGTKEIVYANGNKTSILPDGTKIISYYNGDIKEIHEDRTVYVYGTDRTSHTTFVDGKEVLEFPNGQKETHFSDGSSEIIFPDTTLKKVLPDGTAVSTLPDGTIVRTNGDGFKVMEFVSGQKEVHTPEQKRREYPDGTVKIVHPDGHVETRYRNGRVRIKDREGNLVSDTHQHVQ